MNEMQFIKPMGQISHVQSDDPHGKWKTQKYRYPPDQRRFIVTSRRSLVVRVWLSQGGILFRMFRKLG